MCLLGVVPAPHVKSTVETINDQLTDPLLITQINR